MTQQTVLIVDTANLLFRVSSAHSKNYTGSSEEQAGLAMHMALMSLRSQYNKFQPNKVVVTFEGGQNWRKSYTRGERAEVPVSRQLYKGNRVKDDSMIPYFELMDSFKQLATEHTSLIVLQDPVLEGDDLIAGAARKYSAEGHNVVILSDDKDFVQLLQIPNVRLIRPDGTDRKTVKDKKTGEHVDVDPEFFMYEKTFRGDAGDNVIPALPRVRTKVLKESWDALQRGEQFKHLALLEQTWDFANPSTGEVRTLRVGDLYKENVILMDLVKGQPKDIQDRILEVIAEAEKTHGVFSLFHFQRFCGKYELKRISEQVTNFIPMLSGKRMTTEAGEKPTLPKKGKRSSLVF